MPLDYHFEPGEPHNGVTVSVPLEALNQLEARPLAWLVPGLLEEKVLAMIRSLPKALRTRFVPAPEAAKRAMAELRHGQGDLRSEVARALSRTGGRGGFCCGLCRRTLAAGVADERSRDQRGGADAGGGPRPGCLAAGVGRGGGQAFTAIDDPRWNRDGLTTWDMDELPTEIDVSHGRLAMKAYPALIDRETSVALRLMDSPQRKAQETRFALRRLFLLAAWREVKTQVDWLPGLDKAKPVAAMIADFDLRAIDRIVGCSVA